MFFADFRSAVVECLRTRVKNGITTERSLARTAGISQPHMHNVLKGERTLSPELSDQILQSLNLSLLDLIDRDRLARHLAEGEADPTEFLSLPILKGKIGPGYKWPFSVERYERFRVPAAAASALYHPVVATLGEDSRMASVFAEGDLALLDQSYQARTRIESHAYYLVKRGSVGLIRRLRYAEKALYIISEDVVSKPEAWERIPLRDQPVAYYVRARAIFLPRDIDWV